MTPYVTQADLIERFGEPEVRARANDGQGGIDERTVQRACTDAQGEIDARLAAAGITTPVTPVPDVIAAVAADIARYRLYDDEVTETVAARYADAIKFLQAVARGDARLGPAPSAFAESAGEVNFHTGRRVFGGGSF
ncbi:DUF1320 domain-containing protein [Salinicola sp. JS01]|uniref:DUF1320 domain-containing protein n=1 Tax=Salinicola sp. JS01 TaxID=3050071 RepID=UPI00255B9C57|nr:DUF1320 domain-containing protein [Salinicola sp. JS01]WIX31247.1 DUF1320 domain-containing protein [Salinicola sp. JS01]